MMTMTVITWNSTASKGRGEEGGGLLYTSNNWKISMWRCVKSSTYKYANYLINVKLFPFSKSTRSIQGDQKLF